MTSPSRWTPTLPGAALLERAVGYTRTALQLVTDTDPGVPTPCRDWSLRALLEHMDDSLAAFTEAAQIGYVALPPVPLGAAGGAGAARAAGAAAAVPARERPVAEVVDRLRVRACDAVGAWSSHPEARSVLVADLQLPSDVVAAAGALEILVHGWDVARACGQDRPLPHELAVDLLDVVPLVIGPSDRPQRFAAALVVPLDALPGTRLLAALGRSA